MKDDGAAHKERSTTCTMRKSRHTDRHVIWYVVKKVFWTPFSYLVQLDEYQKRPFSHYRILVKTLLRHIMPAMSRIKIHIADQVAQFNLIVIKCHPVASYPIAHCTKHVDWSRSLRSRPRFSEFMETEEYDGEANQCPGPHTLMVA